MKRLYRLALVSAAVVVLVAAVAVSWIGPRRVLYWPELRAAARLREAVEDYRREHGRLPMPYQLPLRLQEDVAYWPYSDADYTLDIGKGFDPTFGTYDSRTGEWDF